MYFPNPANRGPLLAKPALDMFPAYLNGSWASTYGSNPPSGPADILWWLAAMHRYCLYHGDQALLTTSLLPGLTQELQHNLLSNGTDGLLHVTNCVSPEYPMQPATDCCYQLSIYRWVIVALLVRAWRLPVLCRMRRNRVERFRRTIPSRLPVAAPRTRAGSAAGLVCVCTFLQMGRRDCRGSGGVCRPNQSLPAPLPGHCSARCPLSGGQHHGVVYGGRWGAVCGAAPPLLALAVHLRPGHCWCGAHGGLGRRVVEHHLRCAPS
jgi:hypothetical protein